MFHFLNDALLGDDGWHVGDTCTLTGRVNVDMVMEMLGAFPLYDFRNVIDLLPRRRNMHTDNVFDRLAQDALLLHVPQCVHIRFSLV